MPDERRWTICPRCFGRQGCAQPSDCQMIEVVPAAEADRLRAALREIAEAKPKHMEPMEVRMREIARAALDPEGA